ncbi:MAG: solute:Na+ symporter, family [Solirubrobacteraceae bacterium]|nr:solute:Na+ symporter, family [Solirubrobacteraceae bacterium]
MTLALITEAHDTNTTALVVFAVLFSAVTVIGFVAARWRRAQLDHLDEWGLGGRQFGTVITWFLLGGDLYTAYTFIAVPALVFGAGAIGFFALPYTIMVYPLIFVVMPRLWSVCRANGYVTPADFVRGRYGSRPLALLVALTGILATMPYIALQLVGMQIVLGAHGVSGDWPIIIAFVILAAYTYQSGLRAPALIAVVKDTLIYITILVAVIYIPSKIGGFGAMFDAAEKALPTRDKPGSLIPKGADAQIAYATLAFGSALALFLYPHAITAVLSAKSAQTVRRNTALLPAYTFLLGLIALLGYMAIARGIDPSNPNFAVPDLFLNVFPSWFVGFAFAAIAIGALVPAAVMSIAAANLFTRSVYKEYLRPGASHADEARTAKIVSLVVKVGALVIILTLPTKYAIELQLLGGVWILQTLPAIVVGLYSRWLHRTALVAGWAVGMALGTLMAQSQDFAPTYPLQILGTKINAYTGIFALAANLVVTIVLTLVLRHGAKVRDDADETRPQDFDELAEGADYPSREAPAPVA